MALKCRPTADAQVTYHLDESRGTWEAPLATFAKTKDRKPVVSPDFTPSDALPVPSKLGTADDVRHALHRAQHATITARTWRTGFTSLHDSSIAFFAAIGGGTVVWVLTDADLGGSGWTAAAILAASFLFIHFFVFVPSMMDENRMVEIWGFRIDRYVARLRELELQESQHGSTRRRSQNKKRTWNLSLILTQSDKPRPTQAEASKVRTRWDH